MIGVRSIGAVALAAAATAAAQTRPADIPLEQRQAEAMALKRVSSELVCQCGCDMILAECSHQSCPFALPERDEIIAALRAGKSDEEIIGGYVERYGRGILAAPPTDGGALDRFSWFAPYLAMALGLGLVLVFLRGFLRAGAAAATPDRSGPALPAEERERIERELAAGDGGPGP